MTQNGYVPLNIAFVFSDSSNVDEDIVISSFPVDADNQKTISTAYKWAALRKGATVQKVVFENNPISDVKILRIDSRGEGGRAYKVVVHGDYLVDFREEELMWVIKNKGILPGGIMGGEFVFGVVSSHMKLLPVGSPIENICRELGIEKEKKNFSATKICHKYKKKNGDQFVVIGSVKCPSYNLNHGHGRISIDSIGDVSANKFLICYVYDDGFSPRENISRSELFNFRITSSPVACEDLGEIPPFDMVSLLDVRSVAENIWSVLPIPKTKRCPINTIEYMIMSSEKHSLYPDNRFKAGVVVGFE
jgi:hypothetical protein